MELSELKSALLKASKHTANGPAILELWPEHAKSLLDKLTMLENAFSHMSAVARTLASRPRYPEDRKKSECTCCPVHQKLSLQDYELYPSFFNKPKKEI